MEAARSQPGFLWGRRWAGLCKAKCPGATTHCVLPPRPLQSPSKSRPPAREKWVRTALSFSALSPPPLIPMTLPSRERRGQDIDQLCPGLTHTSSLPIRDSDCSLSLRCESFLLPSPVFQPSRRKLGHTLPCLPPRGAPREVKDAGTISRASKPFLSLLFYKGPREGYWLGPGHTASERQAGLRSKHGCLVSFPHFQAGA